MNSKNIALGGIMVAITTIVLYSTSILPISTLSILTIAAAIIPVVIIRSDIKTAMFVFVASALISYFLVPINISVLYTLFFGIYGIIKFFAEKNKNIIAEFLSKLVFFNLALLVGYYIFQNIIGIDTLSGINNIVTKYISVSSTKLSFIILLVVGQIVFLIFDYALTLVITFYLEKIHKLK